MKRAILTIVIALSTTLAATAQSWTLIPNDLVMTYLGSVSIADAHTVYVTGNYAWADSSSFLKSTDGGLSFHHISTSFLPPGHTAGKVCFINADTGYVVSFSTFGSSPTSDGTIHRTTDGGLSWTPVISGISQMIVKLKFADANTGYAVASNTAGSPYSIYRTTNGGITWSWFYTSTPGMKFSDLQLVDANTGFITGGTDSYKGTITRISGGMVGSTSTFPEYNSLRIGQFWSATDGVVVALVGGATPAYHLLKTSDGGTTWSTTHITDVKTLSAMTMDHDGTGFIVGNRNMKTSDAGASWSPVDSTPFYGYGTLYDIASRDGLRIIVGQSGGIWRQTATTSITESKTDLIANIFPNPVSQTAEINFGKNLTNGTMNVYNMAGRLLQSTPVTGSRATLNATPLTPGTYTLQVTASEGTITRHIVVR